VFCKGGGGRERIDKKRIFFFTTEPQNGEIQKQTEIKRKRAEKYPKKEKQRYKNVDIFFCQEIGREQRITQTKRSPLPQKRKRKQRSSKKE
jgi:hypothetical protein